MTDDQLHTPRPGGLLIENNVVCTGICDAEELQDILRQSYSSVGLLRWGPHELLDISTGHPTNSIVTLFDDEIGRATVTMTHLLKREFAFGVYNGTRYTYSDSIQPYWKHLMKNGPIPGHIILLGNN